MKENCNLIRRYDGFPKSGVVYWDVSPLFSRPAELKEAVLTLSAFAKKLRVQRIAAIEAKGFVLGAALAYEMELPLTLIRKAGLIPGQTMSRSFTKEYGQGTYEIKSDSLQNQRVLVVYDILAEAGASLAAASLLESAGAKVSGFAFAIELEYLKGRELLKDAPVLSLVHISNREAAPVKGLQ